MDREFNVSFNNQLSYALTKENPTSGHIFAQLESNDINFKNIFGT